MSIVTSIMVMKVKDITETLRWITDEHLTRAIIATNSMSNIQKVERKMLYAIWIELIREGGNVVLNWIFFSGYTGVTGNERADTLSGQAPISGDLTLDPPTVLANVNECLLMHVPDLLQTPTHLMP